MTKEVYQKSVDILLDAYNKRQLEHSNCYACAVGNLVAANNDLSLVDNGVLGLEWNRGNHYWDDVFMTGCSKEQHISLYSYKGQAKQQIDSTGISVEELMKIEFAFETAEDKDGEQFKGLCAVLDVMKDMVEEDVPHKENIEKLESIHEKVKL